MRRRFRLHFNPWIIPDADADAAAASAGPETNRRIPEEFPFELYEDGSPILVDNLDGKPFTYLQRIDVFRQYIRAHYSQCPSRRISICDLIYMSSFLAGCAKGFVVKYAPWGSIQAHPDLFFEDGMLPEGFRIREPSKLHENDLINFFRHVIGMEHPSNGEAASRFRFCCYEVGKKGHRKYIPALYNGPPESATTGRQSKRSLRRAEWERDSPVSDQSGELLALRGAFPTDAMSMTGC